MPAEFRTLLIQPSQFHGTMVFLSPFGVLLSLVVFCFLPAHSSGDQEDPMQQRYCIRLKMEGSLTARQAQVWMCAIAVPSDTDDAAQFTLSCMEDQGIHPSDEDEGLCNHSPL